MGPLPRIIQGGMGAGVSNWRLARAVSATGQLGVVSGTALDQILVRRLQDGDPDGDALRALEQFPFRAMAERARQKYHIPGGKAARAPYPRLPLHAKECARELQELCILANFVEVFLAREGHDNPVGINYLEKIQIPHLPSMYGAMLAGVDYVLMGAGIPLKVPGVLDALAKHERTSYPLYVNGAQEGDDTTIRFEPHDFIESDMPPLKRPQFLAIIASNTLATTMVKKANGRVDGFVVEGPTAGGHNAPPRGKLQLSDRGEPVYGERDAVDLEKLGALGLPFWLAGGYGSAEKLAEALALGAAGVQVGTAFALCTESGLRESFKRALLEKVAAGEARVFTDPLASPTGFPFKVAELEGTMWEDELSAGRARICDLGYLREAFRAPDGSIDYRCSAEPLTTYAAKGGATEDTEGRKCVCNALMANIGQPQVRGSSYTEPGLVTCGDDLGNVGQFLPPGAVTYSASDVVRHLLNGSA
jgi:nitronate monooxygenase